MYHNKMVFGFIFNIYSNYTWLEEFTIEYKVALLFLAYLVQKL